MRKFSWKNFTKFITVSIASLIWLWLLWSVVDIDMHNTKPNDKPSEYNAFVQFCKIIESEDK